MIMHLDGGKIEALLSGEVAEREAFALRDHLASCSQCKSAFAAAQQEDLEIARLLSSLDHSIPEADPARLALRARRRALRPRLAAAGIALLIVAGAASAMPGSPLRSWLSRFATGQGNETVLPGAEQDLPSAQAPAGVSVSATAQFELTFDAVQDAGVIRITQVQQADVVIQADSEGVGFSVEPRGVRVMNSGSVANYEVSVPVAAGTVVIRVGETIVYQIQDGAIVIPGGGFPPEGVVVDFGALKR
ncbi:MAG: zf-HC2 domain-containing protein [Gemmatimonadota bacterium]|nr:MAG: zf-HC2 domain-containing protein [Gemmatimonadota bacterium]